MGRLAALALLAVIGLALPLAGEAAYPGGNGLIVFSSERADRSLELFTMRPDGSRQRRLTHEAPLARDPAWSPDGRRLALEIDQSGRHEIWEAGGDGSLVQRLARTPGASGSHSCRTSPTRPLPGRRTAPSSLSSARSRHRRP